MQLCCAPAGASRLARARGVLRSTRCAVSKNQPSLLPPRYPTARKLLSPALSVAVLWQALGLAASALAYEGAALAPAAPPPDYDPAAAALLWKALGLAAYAWSDEGAALAPAAPPDFDPAAAAALFAAALARAGEDLGTLLASGATMAGGSVIGGAVAWQLATMQARARAEEAARAATREALNALDPEALTKVLGELPSWLAYRDFERAGWLNRVLVKAWPYLDKATSGVIVAALDPILDATRPAFLTSLRFERFSFGSIPARIEGVKVYDVEGEDAVEVDLEVFWKGNPDVVLSVKAAQDAVRVPVSLTELQVSGTVRLTFGPLLPKFPCFGAISVALMGKPTLAFDLRVVGSDITLVPGVALALRNYFKSLLSAYLVWPRRITVAIPGTGYTIREPRAAGTLHVRLLGTTGFPSSQEDEWESVSQLSSRLRLGSEAMVQVRWAISASAADLDAAAASTAALRTMPEAPLRSGSSVTLAIEDPASQVLWVGVYDRTAEDGSAPLQGEAAIPLSLCCEARQGETVECVADLGAPGALSGGGLAAVARRGGALGWVAAVGGSAWSGVARAGGAVAGVSVAATRGMGGAWNESMRTLGSEGWGGWLSLPRAISTGYLTSVYGESAESSPQTRTVDAATPPAPGATRVGAAWVLVGAGAGVRVFAPPGSGSDAGSLRLELRYETGSAAGAAQPPRAVAIAALPSPQPELDEGDDERWQAEDASRDEQVEGHRAKEHDIQPPSPLPSPPSPSPARRQGGGSEALRKLRLAAGAAAMELLSPESEAGGTHADRAKLAALLEQAERLVEAAAAQDNKESKS